MTWIFLLLAASTVGRAEPIPGLASLIQSQLDSWKLTASRAKATAASEVWDFEQPYLQVNPYVTLGADVVQLQIMPQFGFLWIRDTPDGCVPYAPPSP